MYLDSSVSVEHLATSVSGQMTYQPHPGFAFVPMNIQPMAADFRSMSEGIYSKLFKAFTTASGIVETYRLTVSGTTTQYIVRGREDYGFGVLPHYELILEKGTR